MLSGESFGNGTAPWTQGVHYTLVVPPQPPSLPPGKVEVTEVFSYGCIVCNRYLPAMNRLKASLPANVVFDYVPAAFNAAEDWPVFQRAYLTAQVLGVADRAHDAMFEAVWTSGELAIVDPVTKRIKDPLPTIEDIARFYNRVTGVSVADFVVTANSMGIETRINQADDLVMTRYHIDGTPTIVVNGKYRLGLANVNGDTDQLVELVKWLVAKESR